MEQYELIRILKENTDKSARKLSEEFGNSLHFWSVSRKYQEALNNKDYQFFHKIESAKRDNGDIEGFGSNQSNILKQVHYSIFGGTNDVLRNEPILTRAQAERLENHLNDNKNTIKNLIAKIRTLEIEIEDLKDEIEAKNNENRDNLKIFENKRALLVQDFNKELSEYENKLNKKSEIIKEYESGDFSKMEKKIWKSLEEKYKDEMNEYRYYYVSTRIWEDLRGIGLGFFLGSLTFYVIAWLYKLGILSN